MNIFLYLLLNLIKIFNMKKVLISIGSILIMALVVVLFINASRNYTAKVKTEVMTEETVAPCSATCNQSTGVKTATSDPEACKEMKSSTKESNCDPATCTMHMAAQPKEGKMGGSSSPCKVMCPAETAKSK